MKMQPFQLNEPHAPFTIRHTAAYHRHTLVHKCTYSACFIDYKN